MGGKVFETTEDMLKRVEGLMLLYGAVVQTDERANPHGHEAGWRWLSRALNSLPPDRISAKAIVAFLRTGGYGLHARYRGQFVKMLTCMHEGFLPELSRCTEPDIQPLSTLLKHYLYDGQYAKLPEGRQMPKVDISTFFDR
jgi:nucleoporin GLE1